VRRSSVRDDHGAAPRLFRSPYRCRDCGEKFWVIGRRIYRRAGAVFGVLTTVGALSGLIAGAVVFLAQ